MGSVSTIFEWVIQCINGGLLNVLFNVQRNETANINMYKPEVNQEKLIQYLKAMVLTKGSELPLEVLKSFPENIGGGEKGEQFARQHLNREAVFFVGPLVVAILMFIAVLGLILIICCCCCGKCCSDKPKQRRHEENEKSREGEETKNDENSKKHQRRAYAQTLFDNGYDGYAFYSYENERSDSESDDDSSHDSTTTEAGDISEGLMANIRGLFILYPSTVFGSKSARRQEKAMEKMEKAVEKSSFLRNNQGHFCCCCHILTMILAVTYVVGLITCLIVYFMAAPQLTDVMTKPTTDDEVLKNEVKAWIDGKSSRFNLEGTIKFILEQIYAILTNDIKSIVTAVNTTINNLGSSLNDLTLAGTESIFNALKNATSLDKIFNGTEKLTTDFSDLLNNSKIIEHQYNDTMTAILELKAQFANIYHKIIIKECESTDNKIDALLFDDFDASAVKKINSTFVVALKGLVSTFSSFSSMIANLQRTLDEMPPQLASNVSSAVDLTDIANQLNDSISSVFEIIEPILQFNQTASEAAEQIRPYTSPVVYSIGALMATITVIFFACILLFIFEAFIRRLFSPSGKGPSALAEASKIRKTSCVCGGCRFTICALLFILIIIISLFAAFVLIIGTFFAAEVCPYLSNQRGVNQSDYVLNSLISEKWPQIVQGTQSDILDVPTPRNVLYAIGTTCKPTDGSSPRLLPSIGVSNIVNSVAVEKRFNFDEILEDLTKKLSEAVSGLIKEEMIDQIDKISPFVEVFSNFYKIFDASGAVDELNKFADADIEGLSAFAELVKDCSPSLQEDLNKSIWALETAMSNITRLRDAYQGVANHSNITKELDNFINVTEAVLTNIKKEAELEDKLTQSIEEDMKKLLTSFLKNGTAEVNGILFEVLPCDDVYYFFSALVATGCSNSGFLMRLFGWALALMLTIILAFLTLMGTFNLWCIQSHQIKRFYGS
ncbi:hypothetical protein Aperf_G00000045785 [Anoplocephala perfoliata]